MVCVFRGLHGQPETLGLQAQAGHGAPGLGQGSQRVVAAVQEAQDGCGMKGL